MIRHRKGPGVVARQRIPSRCRPHYIMAYLWESEEAMEAGARPTGDRSQESVDDRGGATTGLCCCASYSENYAKKKLQSIEVGRLIAEVHFIADRWYEEVVAHELMHALIHRMRVLPPFAADVLEQVDAAEEEVAYEYGEWFDKVFSWLWKVNPHGKNAEAVKANAV